MRQWLALAAMGGVCGLSAEAAYGQNLSGVFGPNVQEGHRNIEARLGTRVREDDASAATAARLHGEASLNERLMLRLIVAGSDAAGRLSADAYKAELFWQITPDAPRLWSTGLRFDVQYGDGDTPDQHGLGWTNEWRANARWRVRAVALGQVEVGDRARDGVLLEHRAQAVRIWTGGWGGLELYSQYGTTDDLRGPGDAVQQVALVGGHRLAGGFYWHAKAFIGLTDETPAGEAVLWLGRNF